MSRPKKLSAAAMLAMVAVMAIVMLTITLPIGDAVAAGRFRCRLPDELVVGRQPSEARHDDGAPGGYARRSRAPRRRCRRTQRAARRSCGSDGIGVDTATARAGHGAAIARSLGSRFGDRLLVRGRVTSAFWIARFADAARDARTARKSPPVVFYRGDLHGRPVTLAVHRPGVCTSHCLVLIRQAAARLRVRGHTGHRAVTYFVIAAATIGFGLSLRFAADFVKNGQSASQIFWMVHFCSAMSHANRAIYLKSGLRFSRSPWADA